MSSLEGVCTELLSGGMQLLSAHEKQDVTPSCWVVEITPQPLILFHGGVVRQLACDLSGTGTLTAKV